MSRKWTFRAPWAVWLAVAVLCWAVAGAAHAGGAGSVVGRLTLPFEGARLSGLGPIVAYLEPDGEEGPTVPVPGADAPRIRQKDARFTPPFVVATVGQAVEMSNDDFIFHNVFSYSRPNHFDLGTYPAGESRFVTFRSPGVVKTYCSIHENMSATIFVAPTPWHDVARPDGSFAIDGVPPGRHRLRIWSQKLPPMERIVEVAADRTTRLSLRYGEVGAPGPAAPAP
jgi:plastocyanin